MESSSKMMLAAKLQAKCKVTNVTNNKRKISSDNENAPGKKSGKMVQYPIGFSIRHCRNAFDLNHECVYAICPLCVAVNESTQGRSRAKSSSRVISTTEGNKKECNHVLIQLELMDDNKYLKKNRGNHGSECCVPEYCNDCGNEF